MTHPPPGPHRPAGLPALAALTAGHAAVLAGAVVLAGLLMFHGLPAADDQPPGRAATTVLNVALLAASLGALGIGQILSIRRVHTHSRATTTGHPDERALAAGGRRIGWSVVLAFYPLILGLPHLLLNPPPPTLHAALAALIAASLLLDLQHATWTYRHLPHTTGTRLLPPGSRARIHTGQAVTTALYVMLAIAGAGLLVVTVRAEIGRPVPTPLATAVQIAAAAATVLVPLLLIRPVRRVAAAITTDRGTDVVHLDALDRAAQPFIQLRGWCVLAAALTTAALLDAPTDPATTARAVALLLVLGSAALQLGSLTSINLADTTRLTPPDRRARPTRGGPPTGTRVAGSRDGPP